MVTRDKNRSHATNRSKVKRFNNMLSESELACFVGSRCEHLAVRCANERVPIARARFNDAFAKQRVNTMRMGQSRYLAVSKLAP